MPPAPLTLYVVNCTKDKLWDQDETAPAFVPARHAYTGASVTTWLGSLECRAAGYWLFLSAKYGFIEPDHPIGFYDVTFLDPASGALSDDSLRSQAAGQRRWHDRLPLRRFETVYVWSDDDIYEAKVRLAFEPVGARVERLARVTPAAAR